MTNPEESEERKMMKNRHGFPRRSDLRLRVDAENAIASAIEKVEALGAAPALTDAVVHLTEAKDAVGDFIDGELTKP